MKTCPECQQPVAESQDFCGRCGAALSTARLPGEVGFGATAPTTAPDWPDEADIQTRVKAMPGGPGGGLSAREDRACSNCQAVMPLTATFCGVCGSSMGPAEAAAGTPADQPASEPQLPPTATAARSCANCGAALKPTARFCPECGSPAPEPAAGPAPLAPAQHEPSPSPEVPPAQPSAGSSSEARDPSQVPEPEEDPALPGPESPSPAPEGDEVSPAPEGQAATLVAEGEGVPLGEGDATLEDGEPVTEAGVPGPHSAAATSLDATPPCRQCGAPLQPGVRFCRNCGTPVETPSAAGPPDLASAAEQGGTIPPWDQPTDAAQCTNCGFPLAEGVRFCRNCGQPVTGVPAAMPEPDAAPPAADPEQTTSSGQGTGVCPCCGQPLPQSP